MEKFQPSPIVEVIRVLNELCRGLIGPDSEKVRKMAIQALEIAAVTHEQERHKAQNRRTHHRRKRCTGRRSIGPSTGASILRALNQVVELAEKQEIVPLGHNPIILPPQIYQNRYTLALMSEYRNILAAVVGVMMVQHDYCQREARKVYEVLTQDNSSTKGDPKFYLKRTDLRKLLKERFDRTNFFQLEPSGDEIQMVTISETEAEANYAFQDLCAFLLGGPFFISRFDPDKAIPELASSARSFDDGDDVENRRIRALISLQSLENLIESLGYKNMKNKAKSPVLNILGPGDGNNGRHDLPEATEADIQADINAVVNGFFDSAKFRCKLKYPDLEVVVDGEKLSAPFAATAAANRRFKLPGVSKYVQIFATQEDRREIISNLILPATEVSIGNTWKSKLTLEGRQTVTLSVEPEMDDTGNLVNSYLRLTYDPRLSIVEKLTDGLKGLRTRSAALLPSLASKLVFASVIGCLALTPFFTIKIFSFSALLVLPLALTVFLIIAGRLMPAWRLIRPQQVAIDSFMALMLVALLFFGILPIGRLPQPAMTSTTTDTLTASVVPGVSDENSALARIAYKPSTAPSRSEFRDLATNYALLNPWTLQSSEWNSSNPTPHYLTTRRSQVWHSSAQQTEAPAPTLVSKSQAMRLSSFQPALKVFEVRPQNGNSAGLTKKLRIKANSTRSNVAQGGVFNVEVLVDTTQVLTLIEDDSSAGAVLSLSAPQSKAIITEVAVDAAGNTLIRRTGEIQPRVAESRTSDPSSRQTMMVSARQTPALVIFDAPMQLGKLNKGDVLNANFKPIALSTTGTRAAVLDCTATGVVQDIKRTDGTNVEIRVGLFLTWVRDGNMVNGKLDLLLTDCAQEKENSHYGVLAAPKVRVGEVARLESRYRKP